jgi:hypothetical protein
MAKEELEVYPKEELEKMTRLKLRRLCKARGMGAEDCSQMDFDDMVEWIVDQQGDGGGSKKGGKGSKKAPPKGGKGSKGGKKAPPKGGKKAPPKSSKSGDDSGEVSGDDLNNLVLEKLSEFSERIESLEEKLDTLGAVSDQNVSALDDVRADLYKIDAMSNHFYEWMRADGNLTDDGAPDGLDFEERYQAIEEECAGGNEEGDE